MFDHKEPTQKQILEILELAREFADLAGIPALAVFEMIAERKENHHLGDAAKREIEAYLLAIRGMGS